jgi:homoserine dehydrogenase
VSAMKIGIAGLGTVGAGVMDLLARNQDLVTARAGRPIEVVAVSARDRGRDRGIDLSSVRWYDDALQLAGDPEVEVVVELIGGSEGTARVLVMAAIAGGKQVVTANKALLAVHGTELAALAERAGVQLAFEAAVAGGIPVIKALREGLAGNRISKVVGILNGTCNYILTTMREQETDFVAALGDAQRLGYAEADPGFDVDGIDAAHKLAILAALAFGRPVAFGDVYIEGIRRISALDIAFATELGYRIKLLGIAVESPEGVSARVHPCLVPLTHPIARVEGVFNAVVAVGQIMLEGRGAGAGPTASAVVADLIDVARGRATPVWGATAGSLSAQPAVAIGKLNGAYYLRLMVVDRPGVIADVAAALRDAQVSMGAMVQHERGPGEAVPVVIVTHKTTEEQMRTAVDRIAALGTVMEPPALIRIEAG